MKAIFIFLLLCLILTGKNLTGQGIVISEDGTAVPDGSAILDIQSSAKGLLIPRMSTTDRLSILNPADGLLVFDNTTGKFHYKNTSWWYDIVYNGFPDLSVGHLGSTSITTTGDLLMSGSPSILKFDNGNYDIIWLNQSGSDNIYFSNTNNSWEWKYYNTTTAYVNLQTGNIYAPRFYDHGNTSYYIDPAGYSYLNSAICSGNVGIGVTSSNECLEVALPGSRGTILVSDGGGSTRNGLKLTSPSDAVQYSLIESIKYGSSSGTRELQINTEGGGQTTFGGDVIPLNHFSKDLGSSTKAWDDVYADDFQNISVMCFNNRSVTSEILNYAPVLLSQSREIDNLIDPSSLPPGLSTHDAVNLGNLSAYNYTVNYEQQIQIEQLKKENEELRVKIDWLMKQLEIMKQTH